MKSKIIKKMNYRGLDRLANRIAEMEKMGVYVGVLSSHNDRQGKINNATLAAIHEFGAPSANIPERSFLRSTLLNQEAEIKTEMGQALNEIIYRARDPYDAFAVVGEKTSGWVKQTILNGISPKNKPKSPKSKANKSTGTKQAEPVSSKKIPLIDTGVLIQSIDYEVRKDD